MKLTDKKMTDVETVSMYFNCMNRARKHGLELKVNLENIRFEIYHSDQVVFYAGRLGDVFIFLSGVSLGTNRL
jgi:hypothetical protein